MKTILYTYQKSKYHNLICGAIFACLALPFLVWGLLIILRANETYIEILIPFAGVLICLLFGLHFMFREEKITEAVL